MYTKPKDETMANNGFIYATSGPALYKIDPSNDQVVWNAEIGADQRTLAVTPDGKNIYITMHEQSKVLKVDASSGEIVSEIGINLPLSVVITPDGKFAWIAGESKESPGNQTNCSICLIDLSSETLVPTPMLQRITGWNLPHARLALSTDGKILYAAAGYMFFTIDAVAKKVITMQDSTGSAPMQATDVSVSPDNKHVYVTSDINGCVRVINTSTKIISGEIKDIGGTAMKAIVPASADALYINSFKSGGAVFKIDPATRKIIKTLSIDRPTAIALTNDGKYLYVSNQSDKHLIKLDTSTMDIVSVVEDVPGAGSVISGN